MQVITTDRLVLRPLGPADVDRFVTYAGAWAVASRTTDIPFPLTRDIAGPWLTECIGEVRRGIELGGELIGAVGFFAAEKGGSSELGFWIGEPWWGKGYASEAARALVERAAIWKVPAFTAAHFHDNPASGRVIARLGFHRTGNNRAYCTARREVLATVEYRLDIAAPKVSAKPAPRGRRPATVGRLLSRLKLPHLFGSTDRSS